MHWDKTDSKKPAPEAKNVIRIVLVFSLHLRKTKQNKTLLQGNTGTVSLNENVLRTPYTHTSKEDAKQNKQKKRVSIQWT